MGKDLQPNTRPKVRQEKQYAEAAEKGHFAKCCNSTQVANVEQSEPDEEECNFINSNSEENYSVLKICESSIQTEMVKNLEVINSATGKTKCPD